MTFIDIKGQDNAVFLLKRELTDKRVASSYLFFGPDGIGKDITALTLAKALNCLSQSGDSCDECASCLKIASGNHPDVQLFVPNEKGSITIEAIRGLQDRVNLKPYEGLFKVFIIKNSDAMTEEAANCLLKTLEEPPRNSIIILITSRPEAIIPTVMSRCRQVKFNPLGLELRVELAEAQGLDKKQALFLARLANSGARIPPETEGGEHDIFSYKNKVLDELNSGDKLLGEKSFIFNRTREEVRGITLILEAWFRDIVIAKSSDDSSLIFNSDRTAEIRKIKDGFSYERLGEILGHIEEARFALERNVGIKIALNDLKIKLAERNI